MCNKPLHTGSIISSGSYIEHWDTFVVSINYTTACTYTVPTNDYGDAFSSSQSLPRRVVCHPGHPAPTIMGGLVLGLQCTYCPYCRYPLVGSRFRFWLRLWPQVSHQFRQWFRLRPQLEFSYGATFGYG